MPEGDKDLEEVLREIASLKKEFGDGMAALAKRRKAVLDALRTSIDAAKAEKIRRGLSGLGRD